jgi:hypothetical protein
MSFDIASFVPLNHYGAFNPEDALVPTSIMSAAELRNWAEKCEAAARDQHLGANDRERLLKMRRYLLDIADEQEALVTSLEKRAQNRSGDPGASGH